MDSLRRFHLNGLRAVEAVARLGSLSAAADELGVTAGAVSQQVIRTEEAIGRPVFTRTAAGLRPTEFGLAFTSRLRDGFRQLAAAVDLAGERDANRLTVSVAPVFASKWLVPRLQLFNQLHPGLQVRIEATVALVDIDASDVDVAIRVGQGGWPGVKATAFVGQTIFPVCHPGLAANLKTARDLGRVPIIRDANSVIPWDLWLKATGNKGLELGAGPTFSDLSLCLDAAIAGQGVMMGWPILAADPLSDGRLVMPFAEKAATGQFYWFVTSATRKTPHKVKVFCDWLTAELRASLDRVPGLAAEILLP